MLPNIVYAVAKALVSLLTHTGDYNRRRMSYNDLTTVPAQLGNLRALKAL